MPSSSMPMAFLVIPIGGESFPFHWLWNFMNGLPDDDHSLLTQNSSIGTASRIRTRSARLKVKAICPTRSRSSIDLRPLSQAAAREREGHP